ncbi:hypothetical protein GCM10023172_15630 [Hymenobacter ginsengisoli]|uniref:Uncharacterized protein n=1 Tax=Hymenobacter ginsengisoli TaxID=1051626 RepID=A0ABP8Q6H4_9BACT
MAWTTASEVNSAQFVASRCKCRLVRTTIGSSISYQLGYAALIAELVKSRLRETELAEKIQGLMQQTHAEHVSIEKQLTNNPSQLGKGAERRNAWTQLASIACELLGCNGILAPTLQVKAIIAKHMTPSAQNTSSSTNNITSDKTITFSLKEFIAICVFLVTLGISIGGYVKVAGEIEKVADKIDSMNKEVTDIKVQNAEIKTLVSEKKQ